MARLLGDCPLKVPFHRLFQITSKPDIEAAQAFSNGQWESQFTRQLNEDLSAYWTQLHDLLNEVTLPEGRDRVVWALEKSKKYSTSSLYKLLTSGGVRDSQMMLIWKCNIPLKVKIFIWMAVHDIIQSGVQLKKKKWSGPVECATCDKIETSDHILSQCPVAVFMWAFLRDSFGWQSSPANCSKFFVEFVDRCRGKRQQVLIFICAGALFGQFGSLEMTWRLTRRCCRLHW